MQAQITIGGNVYGGGNKGDLHGRSNVTIYAGDLNEVYGGARQADVDSCAFVHIAGANMSDDIIINRVYGGNDISGTVGATVGAEDTDGSLITIKVPEGVDPNNHQDKNYLKTFNTFVLTTKEKEKTTETDPDRHIFIGQVYGGSNGDYDYTNEGGVHIIKDKMTHEVVATTTDDFTVPNINKAFLDIHGGTIANAFGGGNNATINEATVICINNDSEVTTDEDLGGKLTPERMKLMGLNTLQTYVGSNVYQFARVFGGNNKATMAIRPTWYLEKGKIRDLYSGGNQGSMTYYDEGTKHGGIILNIDSDDMVVNNVYGGCRMADVVPGGNRNEPKVVEAETFNGLVLPKGYSTRVTITGGDINNVYGGNDVSGTVYGGCAVGIHSSIKGDVYGGGNGSYPYTDNATLGQTEEWSDYYYNPDDVLTAAGATGVSSDLKSVTALNIFRPNAEMVTVRLISDHPDKTKPDFKPTIIGGAVYCGGNSATLRSNSSSGTPTAQLKIGSGVYADKVFLGSNGEKMVTADMFAKMAGNTTIDGTSYDFSQIDLTQQAQMDEYMKGCEMDIRPEVIFDQPYDGVEGHVGYIDYSTYIGSFFCGGNVGSVNVPGMNTLEFTRPFVIFDKLVGGCNNAFVPAGTYNASYDGGLIANPDPSTGNKLTLNLADLRIRPMRWKNENDKAQLLEWNTFIGDEKSDDVSGDGYTGNATTADLNRRFKGGNVYGGCYNSGHINGNIIININHTLMNPDSLFDVTRNESELYGENILTQEAYEILERRTGVILGQQGMDVLGSALNVFGGGKGKDTEIWGSTTINLNAGYVFQVFGGSEEGVIGKPNADGDYDFNGKKYAYNKNYSCTVNLNGQYAGVSKSTTADADMSDCEFIYGGGFLGPVCGNTTVNLGNGRIFNSFAGSCNADILGHTETYMGRGGVDGEGHDVAGFPFVRDYVYGGNDMGGKILGTADFTSRVRSSASPMMQSDAMPQNVSSYVEYTQGYAIGLFGGCFGTYDYTDPEYKDFFYTTDGDGTTDSNLGTARPGYTKPRMEKAFVNFRPLSTDLLKAKATNTVSEIYGAGQGYPGDADRDIMQNSSYVLIDIPSEMENYKNLEVWGAGAWSGLGMKDFIAPKAIADCTDAEKTLRDAASAIIDLASGQIGAVYGGSYQEGVTRRTVVNVPLASTIQIGSIFGGAYGSDPYKPCDVYEANVNYLTQSENAYLICDPTGKNKLLKGFIYGGNNDSRRTLYSKINISSRVRQKHPDYGMTTATVFGAGCGPLTWNEYTEVNLNNGANVWEVYGGGEAGSVMSAESVQRYITNNKPTIWPKAEDTDPDVPFTDDDWITAWKIGGGYDPATGTTYWENSNTNLTNPLVRVAEMDDRETKTNRYNTNVIIHEGAYVGNYAYGGGLGKEGQSFEGSGDVYGTTYIALLGGKVEKDIYAAGTSGAVYNLFGADNLTASANAYIAGGSARNVYGGGWKGSVGYHPGAIDASTTSDQLGETHVVIGKYGVDNFTDGSPAISRNVYGGGEGGAVYGTTNVKMMNGYVGYVHLLANQKQDEQGRIVDATGEGLEDRYEEKIIDETYRDQNTKAFIPNRNLYDAGNVFGGGYVDNSSVDFTNVVMYGGQVRNALFGGGEVAAVGRGVVASIGANPTIVKAGKTNVTLWEGHVGRNVFGGGRGYNNLKQIGTLNCDGFIFGQTNVNIFGGEVGTMLGLASGYGNVFGGGDIGYVYGAYQYDNNGTEALGLAKKSGSRYDNGDDGYYYQYENGAFKLDGSEKILTEDCKVLIEPRPRVKTATTVNKPYAVGEYVLTSDLNYLKDKTSDKAIWDCLDDTGIIIHNGVFAGGNTATGSSLATGHANTPSVFGNATASINDVYHRDLITLGTAHIGGLYGDGNLTLVDGYRELNITNYGTDYYNIGKEITYNVYDQLPAREKAYYELKYTCKKDCRDKDGNYYYAVSDAHPRASTITADDLMTQFLEIKKDEQGEEKYVSVKDGTTPILEFNTTTQTWEPNTEEGANYWEKSGVLPVYAGRLMNSIQRADFCGVFGSRMVLQGAQDRVPEIADYTNYTINRVREVSLNKKESVIASDIAILEDNVDYYKKHVHGNYFGIYNTVNYLGALTSDVHFNANDDRGASRARRKTENTSNTSVAEDGKSYYQWKADHILDRTRNNGSSHNKVALASGVYLELTSEKSTGKDLYEKDWGYITGVVELDLINVQTGIGGGYVYAKNEHRLASPSGKTQTTLTALNNGAVTRKWFKYEEDESTPRVEWETSGNFVHSTQTIIDDCYNISNNYLGDYTATDGSRGVPAHYWYIKGSVYVYDQYISAFTGTPNAYSETVEIPLTISAAAHGKMTLLDVRSNKYAYYASQGITMSNEQKLTLGDDTYYKNDPISYWDWYLKSKSEQALFVQDTYVVKDSCKIGDTFYAPGDVLLPDVYAALATVASNNKQVVETGGTAVPAVLKATVDKDGKPVVVKQMDKDDQLVEVYMAFDDAFRSSNNMSHNTGYILTYRVNNPEKWNTWYTQKDAAVKNQTGGDNFEDGPTYHLKSTTGAVLGQRQYKLGELIPEDVETTYQAMGSNKPSTNQATFVEAYIVTNAISTNEGILNPGFIIPKNGDMSTSPYNGNVEEAYIVTKTIQMGDNDFVTLNTKMSKSDRDALITRARAGSNTELEEEINKNIQKAYYCTSSVTEENKNLYGGRFYESGVNYRGLEAWCSMTAEERKQFEFNYDALDLLIDSTYSKAQGQKYQYDSAAGTYDAANLNPAHYSLTTPIDYTATYNNESNLTGFTGTLKVKHSDGTTASVSTIVKGDELVREEYEKLPNEQRHYSGIIVNDGKLLDSGEYKDGHEVYVVKESFQIGPTPYAVGTVINEDTYISLTESEKNAYIDKLTFPKEDNDKTYYYCREEYTNTSGTVAKGTVINKGNYDLLPNMQTHFTIHGISPTETSTLYVSRESDIFDLSKEKIITVIYQYDYEESDAHGNITPVSERHVLNIHVEFRSGVPDVEDIQTPKIVLPGSYITLMDPAVTEGAYTVTGAGWELFRTKADAESHINGIEYSPSTDLVYYYQNGYYAAYYAKTYLGKTYSNYVPVSIANYHDLKKVMDATSHHYYIDHKDVDRNPKIYINDYSASGENGLDKLKDLFDLSTGAVLTGHNPLNTSQVGDCKNLEIIMRTDIDHSASWEPIGTDTKCFEGTLHGDGHTISNLNKSLFKNLCGAVYNLGVTGTFTTAGIVDMGSGYVENCWISTSSSETKTTGPVFGAPERSDAQIAEYGSIQIMNSYYQEEDNATNKYTNHDPSDGHGVATRKDAQAFYNGEVAFDLNDFYLNKRYHDQKTTSGDNYYFYFKANADGTLPTETVDDELITKRVKAWYPTKEENKANYHGDIGYVERRYEDGDFIYVSDDANGRIPADVDERYYADDENEIYAYYPIWPDDYLFFGQRLNYGYVDGYAHQNQPSVIQKNNKGRLITNEAGNRVYRAPAYFRNNEMKMAHFNPYAVFAGKSKDGAHTAYPDMTAIDFTGYNDVKYGYLLGWNQWSETSQKDQSSGKSAEAYAFYPPLLDDGGLTSFTNADLTQNLLAYTDNTDGASDAAKMTYKRLIGDHTTLSDDLPALWEPDYVEGEYRKVAVQDASGIQGHAVVKSGTGSSYTYTTETDHFLVDWNDFNAPISYTMGVGKRMWYQRTPDNSEFVDRKKGWSAISLPFSAELVTTQDKGEITHFYDGSAVSKNDTKTKIGHEYWLRMYCGIGDAVENATDYKRATMNYPNYYSEGTPPVLEGYPTLIKKAILEDDKKVNVMNKTDNNTFLWDYYYSKDYVVAGGAGQDANTDIYRLYYKDARSYPNYKMLTRGTPYIIGFPGATYYEFDLSGTFNLSGKDDNGEDIPYTSLNKITRLGKQTITFASKTGDTIRVSDTEKAGVTYNGYTFYPSYLNEKFTAEENSPYYTLYSNYDYNNDRTADFSAYKQVPASGDPIAQAAFRPIFKRGAGGLFEARRAGATRGDDAVAQYIIFDDNDSEIKKDEPIQEEEKLEDLIVNGGRKVVVVKSNLREEKEVNIVNMAGVTLAAFTIQPGETITTNVALTGVYIVRTTDGRYTKKVLVR